MASNIERLTITDTFTNWRDKINALMDIAVLAPMADEDGVMHIDIPHCNARLVKFNVPVEFTSDVQADSINCTGSFSSSITATTIQETVDAGLKLTGTEGYIPWVSGKTQNGTASIWTSSYDDSLHFAYVNVNGELVNTFSWNPETNLISARINSAEKADLAKTSEALLVDNLSDTNIPGNYPVIFGSVEDGNASGSWDEGFTYNPRDGVLSATTFKGNLDGNAKTASSAAKLTNKCRISLGTDAEGYADFDGSSNFILPCSLVSTGVIAGLYGPSSNVNVPRTNRRFTVPSFRVDQKGRITQAFTRTVEFPFPEVDVDGELNASSRNPIENRAVAEKFNEIDAILEQTPGMDAATPSSPGLMSAADKIKLNGLTQNPRINSVVAQTYSGNSVSATDTKSLSTAKPTQLVVNAKDGLSGTLAISENASASVLSLNLGMQLGSIAGDGLAESNGKLTVPSYSGATSNAAGTAGLVPSATAAQKDLFLNGAGQWASPVGTTYNASTASTAGLMSAADKTKLDGIAAQATKVAFSRSLTSGTKIGTITINGTATDIYGEKNTDTTYSTFGAATASAAGTNGLVPAPPKGAQSKFLRGDKTWTAVYDSGQIDTKLAAKANLASPAFTGTPTVPNANAGTNTQQAANTAFVTTAVNSLKGDGCPAGLDTLKEIAASIGNNTNFKKYVDDGLAAKVSTTSANYIKNVSLSNRTLTITKGDGTSSTFTTVDTDTKYVNFVKSGSTAAAGLVPKPPTTAGSTKYLCENGTWASPAMNENTKVTNTLNTTAKAYITGTTSNATNTGTQVFDTGVFLTTAAGTLQATTFVGSLNGNANTASALQTPRTINGVSFDGSKNITVADSTKLPLTGGTLTGNILVKKSSPLIRSQDTRGVKGTAPTANLWNQSYFILDNNGVAYGGIEHGFKTTKENRINMIVYPGTTDNTSTNAQIGVGYDGNGNWFTYAPTPAAGDNTTKIATTAFVNTFGNGYIKTSGGTITGTLDLTRTTDAQGTGTNAPALRIGQTSGAHLEFDNNEIMAKATANTVGTLYINSDGGLVQIGGGGLKVTGTITGTLSGNASSATKLATARTINGVAFDGTKNITVADSTKVAKAGDTMTGALTLQTGGGNALRFKDTGIAKGTAPSANRYHYVEFFDKNGKRMGWLGTVYYTDKGTRLNLTARKSNAAGDTAEASIGVHVAADGTAYGYAPTPKAGDSSTKIATTAFVNTKCGSYVPLAGGTMTGTLTTPYVNCTNTFYKKHAEITKGSNPSATKYWTLTFCDKNGTNYSKNCIGMVETSMTSAGVVSTYIRAMKNTAATSTCAQLTAVYDTANNVGYCTAPTPPADDNSTKIATTAWVRRSSSMAPSTTTNGRSKNTTYTASTNGWIRCWGGSGLNIGGRDYNNAFWSYTSHQNKTLIYPVAKGQQYYMYEGGGMQWIPAS